MGFRVFGEKPNGIRSKKKRIKERRWGKRRGSAMEYCYAAKMTNWTDCL
jgi:hypothetical protein